MFPFAFLKFLGSFLKSAPYLILVSIIIFGVLKLKSCNNQLIDARKSVEVAKQETQNQKDAVTRQANMENLKAIDNLGKSAQVTLDTVVTQSNNQKQIVDNVNQQEIKTKRQLSKVLDDYNKSIKDADATKLKNTQISDIQINSIWQTYCSVTPQDEQCKAPS